MMTETVYMIRNKKSGCYLDYDGYECKHIKFAFQWPWDKEAIYFIGDLDEPDDFELVEIEVSYKELGVAEQ